MTVCYLMQRIRIYKTIRYARLANANKSVFLSTGFPVDNKTGLLVGIPSSKIQKFTLNHSKNGLTKTKLYEMKLSC